MDSSNRYGVRRMKTTGLLTIEELMVLKPMTFQDALGLSAWLFCLSDPEAARSVAETCRGIPDRMLSKWEILVCEIFPVISAAGSS
jgi:hypothetical protein